MTATTPTDLNFQSAGATLCYNVRPGDAPPVLVLHGLSASRQVLWPYVPESTRCFTYDARGHGLSSRTPGQYRCVDYGADAIEFLQAVVREPAILLGHSLGGLVSVYVAASRPDLVSGVIIVDSPIYASEFGLRDQEEFLMNMHANAGRDVEALVAEGLNPGRALMLTQTDANAVEMMVNGTAFQDWNVEALLAQVICPVAFIHGDRETGSHVYEGEPERAMRLVRHSRIIRIPGSGHAAALTHPEEFRGEVQTAIEWIRKEAPLPAERRLN